MGFINPRSLVRFQSSPDLNIYNRFMAKLGGFSESLSLEELEGRVDSFVTESQTRGWCYGVTNSGDLSQINIKNVNDPIGLEIGVLWVRNIDDWQVFCSRSLEDRVDDSVVLFLADALKLNSSKIFNIINGVNGR